MNPEFLNQEEEKLYCEFIDSTSVTIIRKSVDSVRENKETCDKEGNVFTIDNCLSDDTTNEVDIVVHKLLLEKVKDMPRELLVKFLARSMGAHSMAMMSESDEYMARVAIKAFVI